jgi:hypothetical protein
MHFAKTKLSSAEVVHAGLIIQKQQQLERENKGKEL